MTILPVKAVDIPDVSAMPEKQHCLQMPDQPINRAISAQLESEDDLTCQTAHSVNSERGDLLRQEVLIPEKAQRMAEFFGFLAAW